MKGVLVKEGGEEGVVRGTNERGRGEGIGELWGLWGVTVKEGKRVGETNVGDI